MPLLTLRGGTAVDSYDDAEPFGPACDQPTDTYIAEFAVWRLGYFSCRSKADGRTDSRVKSG